MASKHRGRANKHVPGERSRRSCHQQSPEDESTRPEPKTPKRARHDQQAMQEGDFPSPGAVGQSLQASTAPLAPMFLISLDLLGPQSTPCQSSEASDSGAMGVQFRSSTHIGTISVTDNSACCSKVPYQWRVLLRRVHRRKNSIFFSKKGLPMATVPMATVEVVGWIKY